MTKKDDRKGDGEVPVAAEQAEQAETVVQFGGRIPVSLRKRARMCAASMDVDNQTLLRLALEEFVSKRGF